jgi:hypothetical protein
MRQLLYMHSITEGPAILCLKVLPRPDPTAQFKSRTHLRQQLPSKRPPAAQLVPVMEHQGNILHACSVSSLFQAAVAHPMCHAPVCLEGDVSAKLLQHVVRVDTKLVFNLRQQSTIHQQHPHGQLCRCS